MLRRLFTLLSAASLLLCAAVCFLWLRSYWVRDHLDWTRGVGGNPLVFRTIALSTSHGRFWVNVAHESRVFPRVEGDLPWAGRVRWDTVALSLPRGKGEPATQHAPEFEYRLERAAAGGSWCPFDGWARFPAWAPAGVLAILPVARRTVVTVRRRRVRRQSAAGLCPACGYDLRATPDRCPECGAVPAVDGPAPEGPRTVATGGARSRSDRSGTRGAVA